MAIIQSKCCLLLLCLFVCLVYVVVLLCFCLFCVVFVCLFLFVGFFIKWLAAYQHFLCSFPM